MAGYAKSMRQAMRNEMATLKAKSADASVIQAARCWLHRDAEKVPTEVLPKLALARAASPVLDQMVLMREELRQMWLNRSHTREQLTADLHAWCQRAEASGIATLQEFSFKLRAARA
jgi:stearoyl-CoA desaturase (delta-9 desaturase)